MRGAVCSVYAETTSPVNCLVELLCLVLELKSSSCLNLNNALPDDSCLLANHAARGKLGMFWDNGRAPPPGAP